MAYRTSRWRGVVALGLVAGAVGLVADRADLLLVTVVAVVFAAYPRLTSPPEPTLAIERRLSDRSPTPGDTVEVVVTLRNDGESTLWDLRVVDGVPPALTVVEGSPRRATALRPGAETTFEYALEAESGTHSFEPATAVARDLAGAWERETTVAAETEIDCAADADGDVHRGLTREQVGRVLSPEGGTGTEFHATREYRRGDAMSRVDWNRYARVGELSTVEYREERATAVVVLVDAREPAYRGPDGEPHAVARSVAAGRLLLESLLDRRNLVGVAAFGRGDCWLAPGAGADHRVRARQLFATHTAFAARPPEGDGGTELETQLRRLRTRLSGATQVLLLSPLADDGIVRAARRLEAHGYPVTVVSPDVTTANSAGERLAGAERDNRIDRLRRADVPVVDWDPETHIAAALEGAPVAGRTP
jgi:uncharacterized repeat protein (TIGR01451 family)